MCVNEKQPVLRGFLLSVVLVIHSGSWKHITLGYGRYGIVLILLHWVFVERCGRKVGSGCSC